MRSQGPLVAVHNSQPFVEHKMPLWLLVHGAHLGISAVWRVVVEHESECRIRRPGCAVSHACS
jgi:hypothetical protein